MRKRDRQLTRSERRERRRLAARRHRVSGRSVFTIAEVVARRASQPGRDEAGSHA